MFESTAPFTLFDYFRVPYDVVPRNGDDQHGIEKLAMRTDDRTLSWPTNRALASGLSRAGSYFLNSTPLFGRVASDAQMRPWLQRKGGTWEKAHTVRDQHGRRVSAVWRKDDGSYFVPFDPAEVIDNFWSERYQALLGGALLGGAASSQASAIARRSYYRARQLLPRGLQMSLRRSFSRVQARARFPRWPVETALHELYGFLFELVTDVAERPVPFLGAWPAGRSWALVLTHDVEKAVGYANIRRLLAVELEAGYRSSWNFVPQRGYDVEAEFLGELRENGFEIGVHGLLHDGRDLSSLTTLGRRLPVIRAHAERWQATGFRSPGTLRSVDLMPLLGFDYDSSYSDTAPYEPQPGGCCTWLPYMIENLVELPITLAQDHTLFELLQQRDERTWVEKASFLRDRGGMALILIHPDYIENPPLLSAYRRFLEEFRDDSSAWKALPKEVSAWWRRRSESTPTEIDGEWQVVGPAQNEARIEFTSTQMAIV
jgi:peptidoglycan/xylan/chitin deacetylase (PgdA/CDA1 family)